MLRTGNIRGRRWWTREKIFEKLSSLSFTVSCPQRFRTTGCSIDPVPCTPGTTISQEDCKEKTSWEKNQRSKLRAGLSE